MSKRIETKISKEKQLVENTIDDVLKDIIMIMEKVKESINNRFIESEKNVRDIYANF